MRNIKKVFLVGVAIIFGMCAGCSKEQESENKSNSNELFYNSEESYDITEDESTQPEFFDDESTSDEEIFDEESDTNISSLINLKKGWYIDGDYVVVCLPSRIYGDSLQTSMDDEHEANWEYNNGIPSYEGTSDIYYDDMGFRQGDEYELDEIIVNEQNYITQMCRTMDERSETVHDFNYDDYNRIKGSVIESHSGDQSSSVSDDYSYDSDGNLVSIVQKYNSGNATDTVYSSVEYTNIEYDINNKIKKIDYSNSSSSGRADFSNVIECYYNDEKNVNKIIRYWSYEDNGNIIQRETDLSLEYDHYGNIVHIAISTNAQDGDKFAGDGFYGRIPINGDIYIDYDTYEISLDDFPKYFFNYFLEYGRQISNYVEISSGIDIGVGEKEYYERMRMFPLTLYRKNGNGLIFSNNILKYVLYDDLDLTMEDVYDFYK